MTKRKMKVNIDGTDYEIRQSPIGIIYVKRVCDFFFHCHKKCVKSNSNKKCKRYQYLKKVIKDENKCK